jgi:hypothetical protein
MQRKSPPQNSSTGFITGAGTVNDRVSFFRDERRVLKHFFWGDPFCARDHLSVRQQVERLANIKEKVPRDLLLTTCEAHLL